MDSELEHDPRVPVRELPVNGRDPYVVVHYWNDKVVEDKFYNLGDALFRWHRLNDTGIEASIHVRL